MKAWRPVEYRILYAIAMAVLLEEPSMMDAEWKARVKDRLAAQSFEYPKDLEMLTRAMNAANHVYEKRHGQRPIPSLPVPPKLRRTENPQIDPPWRGHQRDEGAQSIRDLVEKLLRSQTSKVPLRKPGAPDE